jgi:thymidine phosphorylase
VTAGQPLLTLHADDPERFVRAVADLEGGVEVADPGTDIHRLPLVLDRIGG